MVKGIGSWLVKNSDRFPEKTALVFKDKRITYPQLNEHVNRLANGLLDIGVCKGDRVGALLYNSNQLIESMFACAKIGAIFVPINYRLSTDEVAYIVRDSGAHHFIYDENVRQVVDQLRVSAPSLNKFIHVGSNAHDDDLLYDHLLAEAGDEEPRYDIHLDDIHMIMYTSGTTGKPKGAMITHGNTQWNAINTTNARPVDKDDITLTVAPMFHIGGMNIYTTPYLYQGATIILDDQFRPQKTLELIEKEKVTTLFLVPAMWLAITQNPNIERYDMSSLHSNVVGGAPCPITVIEYFQQKDIPFYQGFGLTETGPGVSNLGPENSLRKNGSVGKPLMHTDVKIVDPYDTEVPVGEVGELLVSGPNIFVGYWNQPQKTKEVIKNGWFYTGDLASQDEEGFLYIIDRKKDMIISGGENIYPVEVEQVLYRHPNIKEVAVVGIPDEMWGESGKAVIALNDPTQPLTIESIKEFCDGKLASFKIPKLIEIVEMLPRNATGKILKNVLRKETVH